MSEALSKLTGLGMCFSDVAVELPFTLMHPKPKEEPPHREGEWAPSLGWGLPASLLSPTLLLSGLAFSPELQLVSPAPSLLQGL